MRIKIPFLTARCGLFYILLLAGLHLARAQTSSYSHFEARHTHSIALTPDGTRLLALNTPDAKLSVFDVTSATNPEPILIAEIAVGLEPVAVRARTNDEAWVVSELGDSVAVVSLSRGVVIDTLAVPDEPADIVFAQGKAFVSCARNKVVRVFNAVTREALPSIALQGNSPRALATNAAGTRVFVAFQLSGNGTTILPSAQAPSQPAPTNTSLPVPPRTGLIVAKGDSRIAYTVLDNDVAEIDTQSGTIVRYLTGAGTNLFDLAVHPESGDLWVANTEARNVIAFEPVLRGHTVDHRLTRFEQLTGTPTIHDLHAGLDYGVFPNTNGKNTSLAQPTGIVISADGSTAWLAAFASDRVAKIAINDGSILSRIDIRPAADGPREMRGPRSLVLHEQRQRLYALNKLSNTISVISTVQSSLLKEVPVGSYDPMPRSIREGRGFLFDARQSGNGTISCATCHIDADVDGLAWDLGDRGGAMVSVTGKNLSVHDETLRARQLHPMKGPMVTQTLRGMQEGAPFHWRGDRSALQSFNPTFDKLMGGNELPQADIDALAGYQLSLKHHPNPNLNRDGSLPVILNGANPTNGKELFQLERTHCTTCHSLPRGTAPNPALPPLPPPDNNIDLAGAVGSTQSVKNPSLATVYQRFGFNPKAGQTSLVGFGLLHDGTGATLPSAHPYTLAQFNSAAELADVQAFMLSFGTGTAPIVGTSHTVDVTNSSNAALLSAIALLEAQATGGSSDLVVKALIRGITQSFFFNSTTKLYEPNTTKAPSLSRGALLAQLAGPDVATFLGTPPGEGVRLGKDRDGNKVLDRDEPSPTLQLSQAALNAVRLRWPATAPDWLLESSASPAGPWTSVTTARGSGSGLLSVDETTFSIQARYYRLRRTW